MNGKHLNMIRQLKMMTFEGYMSIYNAIAAKAPCNFLVFGVGRDTGLWLSINSGGKCLFLEDSGKWIRTLQHEYAYLKDMNIIKVKYNSHVRQASSMLTEFKNGNKNILDMELPEEVANTQWDIILVDGPFGKVPKSGDYKTKSPGRMKSIYAAYKLTLESNNSPLIFIHDCERPVEAEYCDFFFGSNFELIDGSLRSYKL